jgi:hypothetical protein
VLFGCKCGHFVSLATDDAHILGSFLSKIKKNLYRTIPLFLHLGSVFREFYYCIQFYFVLETFSGSCKSLTRSEETYQKVSSEFNTAAYVGIILRT